MTPVLKLATLRDLSSRNDKIKFVKDNADSSEFIYLLKVLLDNTTVLGIKQIPPEWHEQSIGTLGTSFTRFTVLVDYLIKNNRSQDTLDNIKDFLATCNVYEAEVYAGVLTKSYKIGVTGKSINKALGYPLVNDFTLQKAEPFSEGLVDWSSGYVLGEEKYDGVRCAIFLEDGVVTALTYNNKVVHLTHIANEVKALAKKLGVTSIMFDGELLGTTTRVSTSGLVNRLIKSPEKHDDNELSFTIFHYMSIEEFKSRNDPKTIQEVSLELGKWKINNYESARISFSEYYTVYDMKGINKLFETVRSKLGEGLMIKAPTAKYEWKRTSSWLKLKSIYSTTLKVTGTYLAGADTKYKGLVGGLECETLDGHTFLVGGGLSDDERLRYLEDTTIIGKLMEVRFTDVNFAEDGKLFLDFPRLIGERVDKETPDTLEQAVHEVPKYIKFRKGN